MLPYYCTTVKTSLGAQGAESCPEQTDESSPAPWHDRAHDISLNEVEDSRLFLLLGYGNLLSG